MAALYKQFLASPSSSMLAEDASLHYVPTTTSIKGSAAIIKHLGIVSKQVRKKKEDILNTVDGQTNAAFEVDTGLEFLTSGGPYLTVINQPKLDDNLICDRAVYLPIHHFIHFDEDGKISQIRLAWDQGALLKQVEAIGRTGLNWPIKDSRDQIALIQTCLKSTGTGPSASAQDRKESLIRTRGNSTNALRDPHTSLHMQPTREELENIENSQYKTPYAGSKRPQQRGFADILGDDPAGEHYEDRNAMSPNKGGGGKNYQPMRIFDGQENLEEEEEAPQGRPPSQYIKPNPNKYKHFDFADGSDPADAPQAAGHTTRPKSKHDSQWSFEDFTTPAKRTVKPVRPQEVRHWDTDRATLGEDTPAPQQSKGRREAEAHFELQDDGEQVPRQSRVNQKGSIHNEGLGLYKNKLFDQGEQGEEPSRALGNITNLKGRGETFESHFQMTDDSPAQKPAERQPIPQARQKAVKMMDANWSSYDESPKQKENTRLSEQQIDNGINIAGDGMGGRKGTNRNWLYGGDDQDEVPKPAPKGRGSQTAQQKNFWDF